MAVSTLLVGYGWWGKELEKTILAEPSVGMEIVGIVSQEAVVNSAANVASYSSYEDALEEIDPDAVILATPHSLHVGQIEKAAAVGCHVFCEKPLALDLETANRAIEACENAGVVLAIGFQRRCWPTFVAVKRLVESGALGTIRLMEGNYSNNTDVAALSGVWRERKSEVPGSLGFTGMAIHPLDQMVALVGELESAQVSIESASTANLRFKQGAVASLSWMQDTPEYYRLAVFGDAGWAEIHGPHLGQWKNADGSVEPLVSHEPALSPVGENLRRFAESIAGDGQWPIPADEARGTVAALEQIAAVKSDLNL